MKIFLKSNGHESHASLLARHIQKRIPFEADADGFVIKLEINAAIGAPESYEITSSHGGYLITGTDGLGLYYGIGKFLHSAKWSETDFVPAPPKGVVTPACSFRATYFAIHFYNWYQQASTEELEAYMEEMLLWGYSTIIAVLPIVNLSTLDDALFGRSVDKLRRVFSLAKKYGMKVGIISTVNQGLKTAPDSIAASYELWRSPTNHRYVCTSKPEGIEYLKVVWKAVLDSFLDIGLDYYIAWPYDEGGCSCPDCRPWGANGYVRTCNEINKLVKSIYPNVQMIVSTWLFDTGIYGVEGEYEGFYKHLKTDLDWADYIMVDGHGEKPYPAYPITHEVIKPVVNFPEISMFGHHPWGGLGANPLCKHFQEIWDSSRHVLRGGMPYSEGIYEDLNKVLFAGYYWNPEKGYAEILKEYLTYEMDAGEWVDDLIRMMELIEENYLLVAFNKEPTLEPALEAKRIADEVNEKLCERGKSAWRWRILYLRAQIDAKRYSYYFDNNMHGQRDLVKLRTRYGLLLKDDPEVQAMFWELCELFHCVDYNGENRWTHPPVNGGDPSDTFENMKGVENGI
ncbi:MAG: hypothetical protein E7643_09365 [Ruminococcaceae bacterium]|nr:hypothetical protein [Oscillospiraceae bacterium]